MSDSDIITEEQRTADLLKDLEERDSTVCAECLQEICGHEMVMNVALGFRNAPRCLTCLSSAVGRDREDFLDQMLAHIQRRTCYSAGWRWANKKEGFNGDERPACLNSDKTMNHDPRRPSSEGKTPDPKPQHDASWDGGEMGCGDLVLELRMQLKAMRPGAVLKVTALDPGAPEDIPAWCGLTGHSLISTEHPYYWIKRKEE